MCVGVGVSVGRRHDRGRWSRDPGGVLAVEHATLAVLRGAGSVQARGSQRCVVLEHGCTVAGDEHWGAELGAGRPVSGWGAGNGAGPGQCRAGEGAASAGGAQNSSLTQAGGGG